MNWLLQSLVAGVASFGATNVDDLFVLMLFFNQAEVEGTRRWPIVIGQYLGFGALVAVSLPGYYCQYLLPRPWLGLLGVVPIFMGIREWRRRRQRELGRTETAVGKAASWTGSVFAVAVVTVANGADNLGVYTPLFAASSSAQLQLTLALFGVMLGLWCVFGHWLGTHPMVAWGLQQRGSRLVPWLLAAVGIHVLTASQTWKLFL